ncbi:DUF4925 domain-containing protein [Bacteroides sp. AN502(2024)]|uniref:DUF4925 domain-containing protein n=1 Tax=Bacteroides sp. AN502(2024) TaxID=3160599 RepID=UPI003515C1C2
MKKNLFYYLFAVLCTASLFTSCSDEEEGPNPPVNPLVGVYRLSDYETAEFTMAEGEDPIQNFPMAGPLYANWNAGEELFPVAANGMFRMMGAAMLPQVLNTIELKEDGNIVASYIDKPTLQGTDKFMEWAMGGLMGRAFPEKSTITSLAATSGFMTSPTGLATWTESNGKVVVKLNITNILGTALGGQDVSGLEATINQILTGEPAVLKGLLKSLFQIDLTNVTDASIRQLQGWALNGIPMNKKEEGGRTYLYLDKSALDAFMVLRDTGEIDEDLEEPIMKNDLMHVWEALSGANLIPAEAASARALIQMISAYWSMTNSFDLGLDLVKQQ